MSTPGYASPPTVERLYVDHHNWLHGFLRRRLGNAADAADLTHDAFLRLLVKPAPRGLNNPFEARAYLRQMANGMCINLWHRREIEQAWLETLAAQPEDTAPSAEHQVIVLQALHEIGTMLLGIPAKAAQAFLMGVACQMTDKEVAEILGVSTRMVRKYIAQAMLACIKLQARQQQQAIPADINNVHRT